MGTDAIRPTMAKVRFLLLVAILIVCLAGCGTGPLVGLAYTRVRLPLTRDLKAVPLPVHPPGSKRTIEIKEPLTGFGMYARVNSNALGDIARQNGITRLHFADQEVFSILGIYKTHRVILHGEADPDPSDTAAAP
ncbi:hypothetical protein [uncultured Desulfosarcina sp.]|uniref:hypothetical protein n=1 Tax=uncultured Desulfosarcina sp. TaxID=218289 RepID=UPI0029C7C149|nr:hypothetical protein [uncultured Desulfosarcina sp.]